MRLLLFLCLLFNTVFSLAQSLFVAGPMAGYVELRTANIWIEVQPSVERLTIAYWPKGKEEQKKVLRYGGVLKKEFNTATFAIGGLEPGNEYDYRITARTASEKEITTGHFRTQELWQSRKPAPDFAFLTGSCAYFNEPRYDRPGKPYGSDSSIFLTMAETTADFMLWLGDNWYTREVDYSSKWGLWYRAHRDRSMPVLQNLLKAMPHYAIWDDHDYGPNNFGKSYIFKDETRRVFMNYWANPSYGMNNEGIYTSFSYSDVTFFLLDDRTWRSSDDTKDSIAGKPNSDKTMFGRQQIDWLKDALLQSHATFKIIATGTQVLNSRSPYDCMYHYPVEYKELMDFIAGNKISGVIFFTGDRHHSEVIKQERKGHYPLYDVTVSPLTSRSYKTDGPELNNPLRVPGTLVELKQNFARVSVSGLKGERKLYIDFLGVKGEKLAEWKVSETELDYK